MNKEELIKEYDEKAKALRDEFISKLEDKPVFELTYPEDNEIVYFIRRGTQVICETRFWSNSFIDKNMFEMGEYFRTKKEVEQHLKECKLLFKLKQWAKENNRGWEPDWKNDDDEKYFIEVNCREGELETNFIWGFTRFSKLPYFKTREIAQECIDLFGDEIKEVLAND